MLYKISNLMLAATFTCVYVIANVIVAKWFVRLPWLRINRIRKYKGRQITRAVSSPQMITLSWLMAVFLCYALSELGASTDIWWSAFVLVCTAIFPIWIVCWILEKISKVEDASRSMVNRVGIYVVIAFLIWTAKALISDEINKNFPFDAALMPVALTAGIFMALFGLAAIPAAILMLIVEVLCIAAVFDRVSRKRTSYRQLVKALLPCVLFIGVSASASAFSRIGLSDLRNVLIARIAFDYDFNDNHMCHAIQGTKKIALEKDEKVLFIGSAQDRGIAARASSLPQKTIGKIKKEDTEKLYPYGFKPVVCNQT